MKRFVLALALTLFAGCHLNHPLTQAQVLTIINDAVFGVNVGCVSGWLEPPVCDTATRVLVDARVAAEAATSGWQAAAKAILITEEARLSVDSKIRPYLEAVITLL